jgi:hypothetical protein
VRTSGKLEQAVWVLDKGTADPLDGNKEPVFLVSLIWVFSTPGPNAPLLESGKSNSHSTLTFEALETIHYRITITGKLCFSKNIGKEMSINCT